MAMAHLGPPRDDNVPLRDYLQGQLDALRRDVDALDQKVDGALSKAEFDLQHQRLIVQINDQTNRMRDRIDVISARLDRQEGRGLGLNAGWVYLVAGVGVVGTFVSMGVVLYQLLNHR